MDRSETYRRLAEAGLSEAKAAALATFLWNVHTARRLDEVDVAHLSDAGFRHGDVCVIRELLVAALTRPTGAMREEDAAHALLTAYDVGPDED